MDWARVVNTALIVIGLSVFFWPARERLNAALAGLGEFLRNFRGKGSFSTPGGWNANVELNEQQTANESPAQVSQSLPRTPEGETPSLPSPESPVIPIIEEHIRSQLAGAEVDRDALLIRSLATRTLVASHEYNYNRIFGSQIDLLKYANAVGTVKRDAVETYFQKAVAKAPDIFAGVPFEQWLNFLLNQSLLEREGTGFVITAYGRDFLVYMARHGLIENKPL